MYLRFYKTVCLTASHIIYKSPVMLTIALIRICKPQPLHKLIAHHRSRSPVVCRVIAERRLTSYGIHLICPIKSLIDFAYLCRNPCCRLFNAVPEAADIVLRCVHLGYVLFNSIRGLGHKSLRRYLRDIII